MLASARRLGFRAELVTILGILVALGMLGVSALGAYRVRADAWESATSRAKQTAFALQQDLGRTVQAFDLVLQGVRQHLADADGANLDPAIRRLVLFDRAKNTSHLGSVLVIDAHGNVIEDSRAPTPRSNSFADHDFVRAHRDDANLGLHVSAPFRATSDPRRWVVALSRRVQADEGAFAGVVAGIVELEFVRRLLEGMTIGPRGSVTLLRTDGVILMRAPFVAEIIGRDVGGTAAFKAMLVLNGEPIIETAAVDRVERLFTSAPIAGAPLLVSVNLSVADIRAEWLPRAIEIGGAAGALTLALLVAMLLFRRELAQRRQAEAALRRSEADFRLLAEHSSDMVTRLGRDGARRYVSPASQSVLGWSPATLLGRHPDADIHADDVAAVRQGMRRLADGERPSLTLTYRMRHATGDWVWIEATLTSIRDAGSGAPDGVVKVARDVTERKQLESDLAKLASQDALTGLANRRTLDATLAREWLRAARGRTPLSALLLDVDHFKSFNDTYGHQEGDVCLRRVADVVGGTIRRASDLAARYGGEEFLILLAETDEAGAAAVAARVREELASLRLAHIGGGIDGLVTVSIGIATARPTPTEGAGRIAAAAAGLLRRADAALYEAKRGGRDRAVAAEPAAAEPVAA